MPLVLLCWIKLEFSQPAYFECFLSSIIQLKPINVAKLNFPPTVSLLCKEKQTQKLGTMMETISLMSLDVWHL